MANIYGGQFNNVQMISDFDEDGNSVFYVRPFSEESRLELERLKTDAPRASSTITITEKDGTYRIAEEGKVINFVCSFWGMLFRRFLSESKTVCVDPINEEKYYAVIFSANFIAPCERRLAA